jgi:hypothetical protein
MFELQEKIKFVFLLLIYNTDWFLFLLFQAWYSLYINCGGKSITVDGNKTYDDDSNEMGPSRYRQIGPNWALITAGHFFDSGRPDYYTWSNTTKLAVDNNDPKLYMDARVSPNSLTYYGFCLGNGNYTVKLHFAEIMFSDDKTYSSIGRRVFDIYIQVHVFSFYHIIPTNFS